MPTDGSPPAGTAPTIDYPALMRQAVVGVLRQVLARVADEGLPGDHYFYLTFGTTEDDVNLSPRLRGQYPEEMTIVLQHQFWNLEVDEKGFSVTLRFGGSPERLSVPWPALRSFADPSVGFGLRLQMAAEPDGMDAGAATPNGAPASPVTEKRGPETSATPGVPAPSDKVVDLGRFRRKATDPDRDPR